jgi:hypothetical protein
MGISGRYPMNAVHPQEVVNIPIQHGREARAWPLAARYVNAANNALASWRSAVSEPSVNQP